MNKILLNHDWQVRYEELECGVESAGFICSKSDDWLPASLPCDVHIPLIESGIIKEPVEGMNSFEASWIEKKSWWFKKQFTLESSDLEFDQIVMNIESVDSEADIFLNGVHLGHHRSAFYPFRRNIKALLQEGKNTLLLRATTGNEGFGYYDLWTLKRCTHWEGRQKGIFSDRGDRRRAFLRKPQFGFGWDWAPRVSTCGIMDDVWLEFNKAINIASVHGYTKTLSNNRADLEFQIEAVNLDDFATRDASLKLSLFCSSNEVLTHEIKDFVLCSGSNFIKFQASLEDPRLWWPNGMGEQNLYTVKTELTTRDRTIDYPEFKIGIRTIRLCQDRINSEERLFTIEINGVNTFCKGANWVPADSIYARIPEEKYASLVREAAEANFNMLRVWGGGLYEKNTFYEKCDELGIMIWQDYMFACDIYPDNQEWYVNEVEKELQYQTKRLRNHPSVILWCGNNESHFAFLDGYLGMGPVKELPFFGGAHIYNYMAPEAVNKLSPEIPYWNSSPYGGEHPKSHKIGDNHSYYNELDINKLVDLKTKFLSEFAQAGPMKISSYKLALDKEPDLKSQEWQYHTNTFEEGAIKKGIHLYYTEKEELSLEEYLLYGGLLQGMMYSQIIEMCRYNPLISGSLFWMYNDCWAETGWSIIDYYLTRKISYYFVKRSYSHVKLILKECDEYISCAGINDTADTVSLKLEYGYTDFEGKYRKSDIRIIELKPYSRNVVLELPKGGYSIKHGLFYAKPLGTDTVLPAILTHKVYKELQLPKPALAVSNFSKHPNYCEFRVCCDTFAHAVHFNLSDDTKLSDDFFDLLPGESRTVRILNNLSNISETDIIPVSL